MTTYKIGRNTIDHMQLLGLNDVTGLLPGGSTNRTQSLAALSEQRFTLQGSNDRGFGTAVEVDGVRLSNNTSFGYNDSQGFISSPAGIDTRNIGSTNIESVEVITGIPSVEYGDIANGVVKVNTRKGKTDFIIEFTAVH
ncbi:MAG: TonB-dependent receptor plug domain-containing protein [Dysgonamonadaceae bacterium]|nr:TonB-dependent receptor plug domain-containing protein [Dysgonamonadaceae bacterium]